MSEQVLVNGRVAVVTGAASGIGLAAACKFATLGMKVCLADLSEDLESAFGEVSTVAKNGSDDVMCCVVDVGKQKDIESLKDQVYKQFGQVNLLMNNAATRSRGTAIEDYENWQEAISVNLFGVIHGVQTFVPAMIAQGNRCMVVNTGSKQGITNPPGNLAYNVSKSALKSYTEGLQHELRNMKGCKVTAHLLVPGWTTTGKMEPNPGAWLPHQVVDRLIEKLKSNDFYIMCPDNEVSVEMDEARVLWAAGDLVENRPALSRWHPDFSEQFEQWQKRFTA
ncbi:MAG: SDR family NAD(P)-dependent oxidoreductase [Arenicellales bacterium]|nr:SDR family NAD(P)-dependent oxidoreductase [Arenicellales bacterium]